MFTFFINTRLALLFRVFLNWIEKGIKHIPLYEYVIFSLLYMTFEKIKEILSGKTVGIAGCGGLGSNCAVALARTGIGKLIIADFDLVEKSNLNRQFYFYNQVGRYKSVALAGNLFMVNPETKVEAHNLRLDDSNIPLIFNNCNVLVEAFDRAEMKEMIIETVLTKMPGIPLVVGSGMAGYGQCNSIVVRRAGNLYLCGDENSEIGEENPPLAPRVGIVAHMQANVVLEILLQGL